MHRGTNKNEPKLGIFTLALTFKADKPFFPSLSLFGHPFLGEQDKSNNLISPYMITSYIHSLQCSSRSNYTMEEHEVGIQIFTFNLDNILCEAIFLPSFLFWLVAETVAQTSFPFTFASTK